MFAAKLTLIAATFAAAALASPPTAAALFEAWVGNDVG